jgi:hypothetical protein
MRTVLASLDAVDDEKAEDDERTAVALCVTYGVPSIAAARLLECGMESRLLAVRLARELELTFSTQADVLLWLMELNGRDPIAFTEPEREAWRQFALRNDRSIEKWDRNNVTYRYLEGEGVELENGAHLRLLPDENGIAELFTPDFQWVGRTESKVPIGHTLVGIVENRNEIRVSSFGPPELPEYLRNTTVST